MVDKIFPTFVLFMTRVELKDIKCNGVPFREIGVSQEGG